VCQLTFVNLKVENTTKVWLGLLSFWELLPPVASISIKLFLAGYEINPFKFNLKGWGTYLKNKLGYSRGYRIVVWILKVMQIRDSLARLNYLCGSVSSFFPRPTLYRPARCHHQERKPRLLDRWGFVWHPFLLLFVKSWSRLGAVPCPEITKLIPALCNILRTSVWSLTSRV